MSERIRIVKLALWLCLVGSGLLLLGVFGFRAIFADAPNEDGLAGADELPEAWDGEPPSIVLETVGDRLLASVAGPEATGWQYIGPGAVEACGSALFGVLEEDIRYGNEVALNPGDYGHYYCFRAFVSSVDDYIYRAHHIDYLHSAIFVTQDKDSQGRIILEAASHFDIDSWQNVDLPPGGVCDSEAFADPAAFIRDGRRLVLDAGAGRAQPASNYCFRGRTQDGWAYRQRAVASAVLEIEWMRKAQQVIVHAAGLPAGSRGEHVLSESANCSLDDFADRDQVAGGNSIPVTAENAGRKHCFRIKDRDHTYHYAEIVY